MKKREDGGRRMLRQWNVASITKIYIEQKTRLHLNDNGNGMLTTNENANIPDIFNNKNLVSLSRTGIENLSRLENRSEPWLSFFMHHGAVSAR